MAVRKIQGNVPVGKVKNSRGKLMLAASKTLGKYKAAKKKDKVDVGFLLSLVVLFVIFIINVKLAFWLSGGCK